MFLFEKHGVPKGSGGGGLGSGVDVISIDVDMFDFWILQRILASGKYRPRVILVETNPSLCVQGRIIRDYQRMNDVPLTVVHPMLTNQTVWDGTRYINFAAQGESMEYESVSTGQGEDEISSIDDVGSDVNLNDYLEDFNDGSREYIVEIKDPKFRCAFAVGECVRITANMCNEKMNIDEVIRVAEIRHGKDLTKIKLTNDPLKSARIDDIDGRIRALENQ